MFSTLLQVINTEVKTLHSFSTLGSSNTLTKFLIVSLFSMAGVPPFLGFFSKIFVFLLLFNSFFMLYFFIFISLLLVSLYFYLQNIRFLNDTSSIAYKSQFTLNQRLSFTYYFLSCLISFFLLFGVIFTEDLFIIVSWIIF